MTDHPTDSAPGPRESVVAPVNVAELGDQAPQAGSGAATRAATARNAAPEPQVDVAVLRRVVESTRAAAGRAGVSIVTGDTKVVPRGKADQLFVTATGVGIVREPERLGIARIRPGDAVLLNAAIGDHGST